MNADWYVDPLGRFDGRFFDGERWTERVSDNGAVALDPDFVPAGQPEPAAQEQPDQFASDLPAVTPVRVDRHLQASLMQESPVRTVAELDPSVRTLPVPPASASAPAARGSRRGPIIWGLLALAAALVVVGFVLLSGDDTTSDIAEDPVQLDSAQEARVEDLEASGVADGAGAGPIEELEVDAPPGVVAPGSSFDADEAIDVGALRVVNGQSVLTDLQAWHRDFAADRSIDLAPSASCWFGQLGGAAVQVAFCGPVGGTSDTEFLFDTVQIVFEETSGGQIAQPVLDAAMTDTVLANALTLAGRDQDPSPLVGD